MSRRLKSNVLKISVFATGLSGIVAEYVLATLAQYFLGNPVVQWAMIVSVMLFSMGLGSRISKRIETNLLEKFILIEFVLSILVAFSSGISYLMAGINGYVGVFIYTHSILIGLLIGMEIPLVVRLNEEFESLKVNISNVLEKDYYGSLVGGALFSFIGLPYLGLTYTPFVLGMVNFFVACILFVTLRKVVKSSLKKWVTISLVGISVILTAGMATAKKVELYGEQQRYHDKVIFSKQTKYQRIVITQWENDYWLYLNGNQQLSTKDEELYHEPIVHPVLELHPNAKQVLVLGGGDGCAVRELLKHDEIEQITLVDLDSVMLSLAQHHPVLSTLNKNSFSNDKVKLVIEDGFHFLENSPDYFDIILVDLPDPRSVELSRLYSQEFYIMCYRKLRSGGMMITQSGSPYFAPKAFACIDTTMKSAGFSTVQLHNQILTMGEWGWTIGAKSIKYHKLREKLRGLTFDELDTKWINQEAMTLMTSFGKPFYQKDKLKSVEVNKIHNPVLYHYYLDGAWELY